MKCHIIQEFYLFLKRPNYKEKINDKFLFIIYSFLFIIISYFSNKLITLFNVELILKNEFKHLIIDNSFLFKVIILGPILEEFRFRAILEPKRINLSLFVFSLILYILMKNQFLILPTLSISIIAGLLVYLSRININLRFYNKNYSKLIYISSILFGLVHLNNYQFSNTLLFLFPLLVLPKIFGGLTLAFIRVKFGLIYAILFHSLHNSIPVIIYFLVK